MLTIFSVPPPPLYSVTTVGYGTVPAWPEVQQPAPRAGRSPEGATQVARQIGSQIVTYDVKMSSLSLSFFTVYFFFCFLLTFCKRTIVE